MGQLHTREYWNAKDNWPHQFTKNGNPKAGFSGVLWQPMVCVHCHKEYTQGFQERPLGRCPARNDKKETKRIRDGR